MLLNSELIVKDVDLKANSSFISDVGHFCVVIVAKDVDAALIGLEDAGKHVDGGRLPCSVVTQETEDLSLEQTETEVVDHYFIIKGFLKVFDGHGNIFLLFCFLVVPC
jgi:hypothetical protein